MTCVVRPSLGGCAMRQQDGGLDDSRIFRPDRGRATEIRKGEEHVTALNWVAGRSFRQVQQEQEKYRRPRHIDDEQGAVLASPGSYFS
jgi:hypothetical protein